MACILVVDEDENLGSLLGQGLLARGHRVLQAQNEVQVQNYLKQVVIDLIIVNLANFRGRGAGSEPWLGLGPIPGGPPGMASGSPRPRFLFLTPEGGGPWRRQEGQGQWLAMPFTIAELERRVNRLLGGESSPDEPGPGMAPDSQPPSLVAGPLALDLRRREARADQTILRLTPTEFNLLHYLMAHAGEVVSAERLLREVWDYHPGTGSPDLVRVHIKKLRDKLNPFLKGRPNPLRTIPRFGYMMEKESLPLDMPSEEEKAEPHPPMAQIGVWVSDERD